VAGLRSLSSSRDTFHQWCEQPKPSVSMGRPDLPETLSQAHPFAPADLSERFLPIGT
jgi:hypothetical protein